MNTADSLEIKMMRPQFLAIIFGKQCRASRIPLITFTSKNRNQSSSGISTNGLGSKMPALLTSMSISGSSLIKFLRLRLRKICRKA